MAAKFFTPLEASRTLPFVRRIVEDILLDGRKLRGLWQQETPLDEEDSRLAVEVADRLEGYHSELDQVGCSFRTTDFSHGLIDFPAMIEDQLVHLCWRHDEAELRYFHDPREGCAGRREIPADLLQATP